MALATAARALTWTDREPHYSARIGYVMPYVPAITEVLRWHPAAVNYLRAHAAATPQTL